MIALALAPGNVHVTQQTQQAFEGMLSAIQRVACYGFRHLPGWRREEMIADVIANAYVAFVNLVVRGRADLAYPTVLANYAIRQLRDGRQVGVRQNVRDVLSPYAQHRKRFSVQPLRKPDSSGGWEELVADRKANPAEIAACRLDFRDWLGRLRPRPRAIALELAVGNTPLETARQFGVSIARISQVRSELRANWNQFQGLAEAA